jgi:hypothetical protein
VLEQQQACLWGQQVAAKLWASCAPTSMPCLVL